MPDMGQPLGGLKSRFTFTQQFRRPDLFGNVLSCANQMNQGSFVVLDPFHDGADKPHFAIRPNNAKLVAERLVARLGLLLGMENYFPVSRVDTTQKRLKVRSSISRKPIDSIPLIRPSGGPGCHLQVPTPHARESLRVHQLGLIAAQLRLDSLLLRYIDARPDVSREFAFTKTGPSTVQHPAVFTVAAPQPVFHLKAEARVERRRINI